MSIIEVILIVILFVTAVFLPSVLMAFIGWKLTRKIENEYVRVIIRACVLSIAFTPTIYGHAGPVFAVWMIFIGSGPERLTYGLLPIFAVFIVSSALTLCIRWLRNHNIKRRMGNT